MMIFQKCLCRAKGNNTWIDKYKNYDFRLVKKTFRDTHNNIFSNKDKKINMQ